MRPTPVGSLLGARTVVTRTRGWPGAGRDAVAPRRVVLPGAAGSFAPNRQLCALETTVSRRLWAGGLREGGSLLSILSQHKLEKETPGLERRFGGTDTHHGSGKS